MGVDKTNNEQVVLTVAEVADQLRIGRAAAYALVHSGQLRAVQINRRFLVPKAALMEFLQNAGRQA